MSKATTRYAAAAGALALGAGIAQAQDKEIVFGLMCDRTGTRALTRRTQLSG
jgi:hypothetical protein